MHFQNPFPPKKINYFESDSGSDSEVPADPLEYWNQRYLSQQDLARISLNMLAIPLMSAECERVFSSAKHLITDSRTRLLADIIEANECLKFWFGRPDPKAFKRGVDPDVDEQHTEADVIANPNPSTPIDPEVEDLTQDSVLRRLLMQVRAEDEAEERYRMREEAEEADEANAATEAIARVAQLSETADEEDSGDEEPLRVTEV